MALEIFPGSFKELGVVGRERNRKKKPEIFSGDKARKKVEKLITKQNELYAAGDAEAPEKTVLSDSPGGFINWALKKYIAYGLLSKDEAGHAVKVFWPNRWNKYLPHEVWIVDSFCESIPIKTGKEDKRKKQHIEGYAVYSEKDRIMVVIIFKTFFRSYRGRFMQELFDTLLHELAHILNFQHPYLESAAGEKSWHKIVTDEDEPPASLYMASILREGGPADVAEMEEFAESLSYYLMTPGFFKMTRPRRTKFIEGLLKK